MKLGDMRTDFPFAVEDEQASGFGKQLAAAECPQLGPWIDRWIDATSRMQVEPYVAGRIDVGPPHR